MEGIEKAGYKAGDEVLLALDCASTEFFKPTAATIWKARKSRSPPLRWPTTSPKLCEDYPIASIEDGMSEDDFEGWKLLTEDRREGPAGRRRPVRDQSRAAAGWVSNKGLANSILVKVNQIGTLSETLDAVDMAQRARATPAVMSHRSGETEDATIADLAVATELRADQDRQRWPARIGWPSTTSCCASKPMLGRPGRLCRSRGAEGPLGPSKSLKRAKARLPKGAAPFAFWGAILVAGPNAERVPPVRDRVNPQIF
jgi:hypothetical protein